MAERTFKDAFDLKRAKNRRTGSASVLLEEAAGLLEHIDSQMFKHHSKDQRQHFAERGNQPYLPARLSPREVEVMRLVAQGQSSRKIAEELMISERTVACHMASIFNKTGAGNRAAAAVFAIRHNLVE